jgi:hypothetical protein
MRTTLIVALGVLLAAGSKAELTAAPARHVRSEAAAVDEQFRNARNSIKGHVATLCSHHMGNPYDKQTDYTGWSAWRQPGAWDSRNDCQ